MIMNPSLPVTPYSMAHWLASIQAHGCFLQYGWRLSSRQLRRLADCIGHPAPGLQRIQEHPILAAHLALAASAGWVVASENRLALRGTVYGWLCQRPAAQIDGLLAALNDPVNWKATVERFRLQELPGVDMQTYLQQQLARSRRNARPSRARHPLQIVVEADRWQLHAHAILDAEWVFHLHQFADCLGFDTWELTPTSLARGLQAGYSLAEVAYWLGSAQRCLLATDQQQILAEWASRLSLVQLGEVRLLTTSQPEYLDNMMALRTLRRHIQRRLGPRHALVTASIDTPLQRYLHQLGVPFLSPQTLSGDQKVSGGQVDADPLIGLHVLIGLRHYLPLDLPELRRSLINWAAHYSLQQQNEAAERARAILDDLQRVVQGRDAFWPAFRPIDPRLKAQISQAIRHEKSLTIMYQGPGDVEARRRTIEPHWIEHNGGLEYVHAFCRLAGAERVFRLDRIQQVVEESLQ